MIFRERVNALLAYKLSAEKKKNPPPNKPRHHVRGFRLTRAIPINPDRYFEDTYPRSHFIFAARITRTIRSAETPSRRGAIGMPGIK